MINFAATTLESDISFLKEVFPLIDEMHMPVKPSGLFEIVESFDSYEFLSNDVEEFSSDIADVDKRLSSLASK